MKTQVLRKALLVSLILLITIPVLQAQPQMFQLIEHETGLRQDISTALHFYENKDAVTRFREVDLSDNIKSLFTVEPEDLIMLNLFSDVEYTAEVLRVEEIMEDNVTITSKILSYDFSYAYISTTEGRTLITIHVPEQGKQYEITSDPVSLMHYLIEIDPTALTFAEHYPSLIPPDPTQEEIEEQKRIKRELELTRSGPWDHATIDVLIVYTPAARIWANNQGGGIFNRIALAVAYGNTALSNSNTVASIRLVHRGEISYTEFDGDSIYFGSPYNRWAKGRTVDLIRLTDGTHGFATAHTWRNTYGADLVQVFTTTGGGVAWVLRDKSGWPNYAFSLAGVSTALGRTPIHEVGHNMGCSHHKEQNHQPGPTTWENWPGNNWSAGWRWQGTDNVWYNSVMSYTTWDEFPSNPVNSTTVPHFSNPSINYMGEPTGDAEDGNNARTIREIKHVIAAYRPTATINCIACPGYNFTITPVNAWSTHSSSIAANGCKTYRFYVIPEHTYTLKTGCGNGASANFNTYLELLDANCDLIVADNTSCESNRSKISWISDYEGYAYLKVSGMGSSNGSYTLAYHRIAGGHLIWTGAVSTNWFNPANWSDNFVPNANYDVTIPSGVPNWPAISFGSAQAKSVHISAGAQLNLHNTLTISNDLMIYGYLGMHSSDHKLNVYGNISWFNGSSAEVSESSEIRVMRNWTVHSGADIQLTNGLVTFTGTSNSYIINYSSTSSFNQLGVIKTGGAMLGISLSCTQPVVINDYLFIQTWAAFHSYTSQDIIVRGNLTSYGEFVCHSGRFVLNGESQILVMNEGNYFNHLAINPTGIVNLRPESSILDVRGNVEILSGNFYMNDRTMHVRGNWVNTAGPSAFHPQTGRVVFNGGGHRYINSSEHFNILEANTVGQLRINNAAHTVTCNQYHWTSGGIDVIAGTFTALDLTQNGLYGGFQVKPGGTINITNSSFPNWVDLYGSVNVLGGTMNIDGLDAWWPYDNGANFTMTGGVLDFKTCELTIYDSYSWTNNVSGGTIRTSMGFHGNRADFTPTGGTFEFYGSTDYAISQSNGSTLHHVRINKSAKYEGQDHIKGHMYNERSGEFVPDATRANTISLGSDFTITGNLNIVAGTFSVGQYTCNIAGNTNITGTLAMTHASGVINATGNVVWNNGSTANFTAMNVFNVYGNWNFQSGSNANLGNGVVVFRGSDTKLIRNYSSTSSFNNISSYKTAGADLEISHLSSQPLTINGNIYVHPGAGLGIYSFQNVILKGNVNSNGNFICHYGAVVLNGTNQSLRMNTGNYFNRLTFNQSGTVTINNSLSNILDVRGDVVIQSGVFNMQDRIMHVGRNWTNNAFPTGFNAATGRVVFNGMGNQYINSHENFNIIETNLGGTLRINNAGHTIICNQYHWTSGGIEVLAGTFTALDLVQNGLYGSFRLHPEGTINLTNTSPGTSVDLVGQVHNFGGTMNLWGTEAWWPAAHSAALTMTGGVIDFKTCDIHIPSGYTWTPDVSGGTIRTAHGFSCECQDFNPTAGTFEFYSPNFALINQAAGTLYHVKINKASKNAGKEHDGYKPAGGGNSKNDIPENRSGTIMMTEDLHINGNLDIEAGILNTFDYTIFIKGNWTNHTWPDGFEAEWGKVVFNGLENQTCSSESFHRLELNKPVGVLFIPQNTTCAIYDWKIGGITANGGTFTAFNLAQDVITGNYTVNSGGTINLHQDTNNFVDLNGSIYINAGTFNVYGGAPGSQSWWPAESAFLFMSSGVLDFKDQGIFVMDHGSFTGIITGGTIRTSKSFFNNRPGFAPAAGTVELYGPDNATVRHTAGNSFHNLLINKSGGDGSKSITVNGRDGSPHENQKANTINALSDLVINNELNVDDGTFILNGYDVSAGGNVSINENGTMVVDANASLFMNTHKRLAVNNSGTLRVLGDKNYKARISGQSSGHYLFDVESGGTLAASHAIFEQMNMNGIVIKPGSMIDPDHTFTECTFQNGAAGGRLLTINNNQVFNVYGAHFPENTWGGNYNVYKNVAAGHVTFEDFTGDFSGSDFEFDPYNRINWGESYLTVEPMISYVTSPLGATTVNIVTNLSWTVSKDADWFNIAPMSGSGNTTLTILYLQNNAESPRSAEVTVSATGLPDVVFTIIQDGTVPHYGILDLNPGQLSETHVFEAAQTVQTLTASNIGEGPLAFDVEVVFDNGLPSQEVEWTVHVFDDGWGDEVSWELRDNTDAVILSGGPYAQGYNDTQSVITANEPLEFHISAYGFYNDNTPSYTVSCGEVFISGSLTGGDEATYAGLACAQAAASWLTVEPLTGLINPDEDILLDVGFNSEVLVNEDKSPAYGSYYATLRFTGNNPHSPQPEIIVPVEFHYEETPSVPHLLADPLVRHVTPPAGTTTFNVQSNTVWTVSESVSWFSAEPMSGFGDQMLTVTYYDNFDTNARSGEITLSAAGVSDMVVTVIQEATAPLLIVTPAMQEVTATAGSTMFVVESNTGWTVSESATWLSADPEAWSGFGYIDVAYEENPDPMPRSANINVLANGELLVVVSVNQQGADIILSITPEIQNVGHEEGTTTFNITSNTGWTVSENTSWLGLDTYAGSGNGMLTVSYEENLSVLPRSGEIHLFAEGVPGLTVTLHQIGILPELSAAPLIQNVDASAGSTEYSIMSNTNWTVSGNAGWLTVSPLFGDGDEVLTVTYGENTSTDPRNGEITLSAAGAPDVVLTVSQAGAELYLVAAPESQSVSAEAGTTAFNIESNTQWTVSDDSDWITVAPLSGSGDALITVVYETNHFTEPRQGVITVSAENLPNVLITVIQEALSPYLFAAPASQTVGNHSGATAFFVESNTAWTASESVGWLVALPGSGFGYAMLTVEFEENPDEIARSGEITLSAAGVADVVVTVYQQADEVPLNRFVQDETIHDGYTECFDAWLTVSLQDFVVENGGTAYIVAGHSIVMLPGTHAHAGSYLHAQITLNDDFCSSILEPPIISSEEIPLPVQEIPVIIDEQAFFRIFPNPTPGQFTLELLDYEQPREVVVHIFSMRGTLLQQQASAGEREMYFDLSDQPAGVYFVRVMAGGRVEVRRVVKSRR